MTNTPLSASNIKNTFFTTQEEDTLNISDGDLVSLGLYIRVFIVPEEVANTKGCIVDATVLFKDGISKTASRTFGSTFIKSGNYDIRFVSKGYE